MTLTSRDGDGLNFLHRYGYARTNHLRDAVFPGDKDGSTTRGRLRPMEKAGLIRRYVPRLIDPFDPQTQAPVWILTLKGALALAELTGDASKILTVERSFQDWMSMNHFCAMTSLMAFVVDPAVRAQDRVKMHALYWEHDVVDAGASDPARRFRLYTDFPAAGVKCCPDAAFELEIPTAGGSVRRAYYVEREMGTDSCTRVVAKKHKGYHQLWATGAFRRHFPQSADFRVLCFCPSASWRDGIRAAFKEKAEGDAPPKLKPGADLWLFLSTPDVTAETFLHGDVVYKVGSGPVPLLPPPPARPGAAGGVSRVGEAVGGGGHA